MWVGGRRLRGRVADLEGGTGPTEEGIDHQLVPEADGHDGHHHDDGDVGQHAGQMAPEEPVEPADERGDQPSHDAEEQDDCCSHHQHHQGLGPTDVRHPHLGPLVVLPGQPHNGATDHAEYSDDQEGPPCGPTYRGGRTGPPEVPVGEQRGTDGQTARPVADQEAESPDHALVERWMRQQGRSQRLEPEDQADEQRPECGGPPDQSALADSR